MNILLLFVQNLKLNLKSAHFISISGKYASRMTLPIGFFFVEPNLSLRNLSYLRIIKLRCHIA